MKRTLSAVGVIGLLCLSACGGDSGTPAPTVTIAVAPASVPAYQTATLTWSSTNASTCKATGSEWAGPEPTSGSLPESLATPGTYTYTLSCSSSSGATVSASTSLTVIPRQLTILTGALSNGVIGTLYNRTLQATGGVAPFAWKVSAGALPHNLSLDSKTTNTVTISGTPDTVSQGVAFTIQISDSAHHTATQPYTVAILLQADSLALSPASLNLGNQVVGSSSGALTETLTNNATTDIAISSIAIAPTVANAQEFKQIGTTCSAGLAPGASCQVSIAFTPGQAGPRSAVLAITDDTAGSPQSVGLTGTGLIAGPNATLPSSGLVFGTELVGTTSAIETLALINYGATALNITSIQASNSFAETNNCIPSLPSGATCTISVTFTPGGSGTVTGLLSISDDAAGSPQKASLSGTGSTMTPLLTGACYACRAVKSAQCPAGAPSKTPISVPAQCGPCSPVFGCGGQVTVDQSRACSMDGPPWHGHCAAK